MAAVDPPEERRWRVLAKNFIRKSNDLQSCWEVVLDAFGPKHCHKNLPLFTVRHLRCLPARLCKGGSAPKNRHVG
jgi:hypothetical protein